MVSKLKHPMKIPLRNTRKRFVQSGLLLAGMLSLLLFAGCGTTQEHRVRQYKSTFSNYNEGLKADLRAGIVKTGYTRTMVYIALGEPLAHTAGVDKMNASLWEYYGYRESHTEDNSVVIFRTINDHQLILPGHPRQMEYLLVHFDENDEVYALGFRRAK